MTNPCEYHIKMGQSEDHDVCEVIGPVREIPIFGTHNKNRKYLPILQVSGNTFKVLL